MKIRSSKNRGSVLLAALVILGLLALTLMATLNMVSTQRTITSRTQKWNLAIPMSEAGVEDAMAHLNYSGTTNLGSDGWSLTTNGTYLRSNSLIAGYYSTTISTASPPVIVSQGYVLDPLKSNYLTRTVQVNTRRNGQFPNAILSKGTVSLLGSNAKIDSFNSTNSAESTGGLYDPTKAAANATVASTSSATGAIAVGNNKIYGSVDTAPGGTVTIGTGAVGDIAFDNSSSGIESGHSAADVNTIIPDVTLPSMPGALTPTSGGVLTNYPYYLTGNNANYVLPANFSMSSPSSIMCVAGTCTVYAPNGFSISGQAMIYIAPGGNLQLYVGGPNPCSIAGNGIVNGNASAANCQIYGLPSLTTLSYTGNASFVGTVYAPEAACTLSGNGAMSGAVVGNTVTVGGNGNFHYDEALGGPVGYKYLASSWQEL
jgi:Tfp pilus assembly protein PilX